MIPNYRNKSKTECIGCVAIPGQVPFSTVAVAASLSVTPGGGTAVTFTADTTGTAYNAYHISAAADGSAKANIDFGSVLTGLDTVMEFNTGGTTGNTWTVNVLPHTHGSGGVIVNEDTVNKVLTIMFEDGVSTVANVETAIGLTTNFSVLTTGTGATVLSAVNDTCYAEALSGGTADTWVNWNTGTNTLEIHFTDSTSTTLTLKTAVNATHASKWCTLSGGTNTDTWATGDAFVSTHLSGGVAASALATSSVVGEGFTATRTGLTGDGSITITFSKAYKELHCAALGLQLDSAANYILELGAYSQSAGTIVITPRNLAGTTVEPAPGTNKAIHFCFIAKQ